MTGPTRNGFGLPLAAVVLAVTPVTVTPECAVTVTSRLALADPTYVAGSVAGAAAVSAAAAVSPKPYTAPSRVPTYTIPPEVAAVVNWLAVPIGADQIGLIVHGAAAVHVPPGLAANASSAPLPPLIPDEYTAQTTAVEMCGPVDVTTGDPDEKPNTRLLLATSDSRGSPDLLTPNFSIRRLSFRPM